MTRLVGTGNRYYNGNHYIFKSAFICDQCRLRRQKKLAEWSEGLRIINSREPTYWEKIRHLEENEQ